MPSFAVTLSITAPVPPAHLSFIDGLFFLRPVASSVVKTMIFASWPPSSTTLCTSGCSRSTARLTAFTSCTKRAPIRAPTAAPPEPVTNTRNAFVGSPGKRAMIALSISRHFSGCRVS